MQQGDPRLLLVTDGLTPGGVDGYVADLAQCARSEGWVVYVLVEDAEGTLPLTATLVRAGFPCLRERISHLHDDAGRASTFRRAIERVRPTFVHFALPSTCACLVPRAVATELGLPISWTEQLVHAQYVISPQRHKLLSQLCLHARAVVAVCEENRRLLVEHFGLPAERMVVIPNGVRTQLFMPLSDRQKWARRAALGWPTDDLLAITTARLHRQKGIDVLLQAAASWPGDAPRICFLVIGDGPEQADLQRQVERLRVADRVRFVGWCGDVPYVLPSADLFVLPTRFEGLPFAVLEAMAAGVPVVATSVSGVPEALDDGRCGVLVPSEDPQALRDGVIELVMDAGRRSALAASALRHVRRHFELDDLLRQTCQLWEPSGARRVARRLTIRLGSGA